MADAAVGLLATRAKVSHDQALEAVRRFENHFWKKDAEGPRIQIPARPDADDDLILHHYIEQQRLRDQECSR